MLAYIIHGEKFFMLSQLGRHVLRRACPVVQLSFIHVGRRGIYSEVRPVTLLEELTQRGFIHDVTRYGFSYPVFSFRDMLYEDDKPFKNRSSPNTTSSMQA